MALFKYYCFIISFHNFLFKLPSAPHSQNMYAESNIYLYIYYSC